MTRIGTMNQVQYPLCSTTQVVLDNLGTGCQSRSFKWPRMNDQHPLIVLQGALTFDRKNIARPVRTAAGKGNAGHTI